MMLSRMLASVRQRPRLLAFCVLLLGWLTVRLVVDLDLRDADTPIYRGYGELIEAGLVPYRDFPLEYPPGALPVFVLPALASSTFGGFTLGFEALMVACAAVALAATAASLRRLETPPAESAIRLLALAVVPVALATIALGRFDLWPASLVALWLALQLAGRDWLAAAALGLAIAVKLFPLALVPLAVGWVARRKGIRPATAFAVVVAATTAVVFVPFLIIAPGGVVGSVSGQLDRPLQLESLGASLLLAGHVLFGLELSVETSSGSVNLDGSLPDAIAALSSLLQVLLLAAVYVRCARLRQATPLHLAVGGAAALAAIVATSKVFSPQFLLWLIVLVVLVPGRRGTVATAALGLAMVIASALFPFRYAALAVAEPVPTALLLLRNALVLGVFVVLFAQLRRLPRAG